MENNTNLASSLSERPQGDPSILRDLGMLLVGTQSKGRGGHLTLAVISGEGNRLYAFMQESQNGWPIEHLQIHDA